MTRPADAVASSPIEFPNSLYLLSFPLFGQSSIVSAVSLSRSPSISSCLFEGWRRFGAGRPWRASALPSTGS